MKILLLTFLCFQSAYSLTAQQKFIIPVSKFTKFNNLLGYEPVLSNNYGKYKIPTGTPSEYLIKVFDIQPMQSLYSDFLAGRDTQKMWIHENNRYPVDTTLLSQNLVKSSMGILIYLKNKTRYYIFDTDQNKDFTNDKFYSFDHDSLNNNPLKFKAAIQLKTSLEYFYKGKIYNSSRVLYFHPSKIVNITYGNPLEEKLYIIGSSGIVYKGKLPDGGWIYFPNNAPKFFKHTRFYPGTKESINLDKYTELYGTLKSEQSFYRIDSVAPDLSRMFISVVSINSVGSDSGNIVPQFKFVDVKGRKITTDSIKGKYTLIDFMGSWCVPCIAALPELNSIYNSFKSRIPFEMVSVAVEHEDDREKFNVFLSQHDIPWNVIYQPISGKTINKLQSSELFMVQGYPTYFLIDPEGRILIRGSGNQILQNLRKLLEEKIK